MYDCKIIADSVSEGFDGVGLVTFEVTYPLIIHAEIMTHRVFSRNVASNRAIPVGKLIEAVKKDPFIPERFPKNKAGMQNDEWLSDEQAEKAQITWLEARDRAVEQVEYLLALNVHKQITNRLLAPFLWTTAVITATDWENFFGLRCHPAAQPEIQKIAYMMQESFNTSEPKPLKQGEWHLPYVTEEEKDKYGNDARFISIGRCARVSYLNHGENNTPEKDMELCARLINSKHLSPTEHVATPVGDNDSYFGNFKGWKQYRKFLDGESGQWI